MPDLIDAHQHFWDTDRFTYPWMSDAVAALRRPFGPSDLAPIVARRGIRATIAIQARMEAEETSYLLALAGESEMVAGVVGWLDLTAPDLGARLRVARSGPGGDRLVGLRHQVEDEPDPAWLLRADVGRGLEMVGEAGLAYDLLVRPHQLPATVEICRRLDGMRLVVDHVAKPPVRDRQLEPWASSMAELARLEHVCCKLSGLVTEADWSGWTAADLAPYVERALGWFGADRCMFGSDWPVCLLAASYDRVVDGLMELLGGLRASELEAVMGGTAARFYGLPIR